MGYLTAMVSRVDEAILANFMRGLCTGIPPGLRLEMHPSVQCEIYRDPDTFYILQSQGFTMANLERLFRVPVKVTSELPDGTWRLVVVTERVITEGGGEPLAIVPRED